VTTREPFVRQGNTRTPQANRQGVKVMRIDFRKLGFAAAAALYAFSLAACNTMEGAGKDVEAAGEEIQEEANEAKD
jgi:predicted small secreted protein